MIPTAAAGVNGSAPPCSAPSAPTAMPCAGRAGHADHVEIAIGPSQPVLVDARSIPGQIVLDEQPAVLAHVVRERLRDRAAIEDVGPVFGDAAQRLGEVALDDAIGD